MFDKENLTMSLLHILQTILEIGALAFIVWGIFNERRLVSFEDKIKSAFSRRKLKIMHNAGDCKKHCA